MSSKLMVNLIDPSEIVIPDTDGGGSGAPDTGIFGIGQNAGDAQNNSVFIIAAIGLVILLAIVAILLVRRYKKRSAVYGSSSTYAPMKLSAKRYLIPKLAGLSLIILVSVFGILKYNDNQRMANAETVKGSALTVTTEDITAIDIEMTDEAVFGVGESKVKVTTATDTGYTLMAYVDSTTTDLTNDSGDKIAMLETSQSQALTDNTWGISLSKPDSQDKTLFRGLPTAEKDAMVVKVSGSDATEANDETTLYYAAYVTPDLDYGTYEGVTINYVAVAHVIDEDVTVNFHGNGYYFDQAGTKDVNTVVYGTSCELAYVGGNCSKIYTTEQPTEIVKTPNIRDDGTQNGPYEIPAQTKVGMASIPGADYLRIELIYSLDGEVIIAQGNESLINKPAIFEEFYIQGETTYLVNGDTASFGMFANSPGDGYDYGFYAKVYPVFYQKPENIETIESTSCHFAKSDNLDDEGDMVASYEDENRYTQSVMLPGADKVKIEIEYALTDEAQIGIFKGTINNSGPIMIMPSPVYEIYTWDMDSDTGINISGKETIIVDGDSLTFAMYAYDQPVSGYDYGFYARLYPIYDGEQESTTPEQVCSFTNKSGEYSLPVGYAENALIPLKRIWYNIVNDDGYLINGLGFRDEDDLKNQIVYYYNELAGKTVDVYIYNQYNIHYDPNGGNGNTDDQRILPHTNATIYYNEFTNSGYEFTGWNTRADGTGTWYQPDDIVLDLAQPGGTITLYAQWEIACNPNATTISGALCMQDFAGPNHDSIINSMTPETQYTLVDKRDNKSYTIAKLSAGDGNYEVWMTQNLDLNIDSNKTYTNEDTDIGYNSSAHQYNTAAWRPTRSTYAAGASTWEGNNYAIESYDPGDLCWNGTILSHYSGTLSAYAGACNSDKHYHIGNYYNWTAAVAMNSSSSYTGYLYDPDQSICPTGWRLPPFNSNNSYGRLISEYNLVNGVSGNIHKEPLYFVYGGVWSGGSSNVGGAGNYWTSSNHDSSTAGAFYFNNSNTIVDGISTSRHGGLSVRCVAR